MYNGYDEILAHYHSGGSFSVLSVSLYRKYRPQDFASVVGQKPAVSILTNALTKGSAGHAYLFSGSRGCGKTSIARIFAKALNCLDLQGYEPCGKCKNCADITAGESLDVIEIDGASNNGVENIRNLRENISLAPFASRHKVYIIDEVHMLSQGAFNALLKTLEEPPEFVVFIMATTEPYKVPVTIRSRCQHIPFHSISTEDIADRLEFVCRSEGVKADTDALYEIARQADGALRDGLSLLEQVISAGEITLSNVEALLGSGSRSAFERVVKSFRADPAEGYTALKAMFDGGASPVRVFEEMFSLVRNMWLVSRWAGMLDTLGLAKSERSFLADEVQNWKPDTLHYMLDCTLKALTNARQGLRTDILLGSFMLSLAGLPAAPATPITPATPAAPLTPATPLTPAPPVTPALPSAPQFDPELKNELLQTAHDCDFVLYCALFDVMPVRNGNTLILNTEHAYTFSMLSIDNNGLKLTDMFMKTFGKVVVRYQEKEYICPRHVDIRPEAVKELERKNAPEPEPEPAPEHEAEPEPEPEPATQTQDYNRDIPPVDQIARELRGIFSCEVLLRSHSETANHDNDILEGDNDD